MNDKAKHDGIGASPECQKRPRCNFNGSNGTVIYCDCLEREAEAMAEKSGAQRR